VSVDNLLHEALHLYRKKYGFPAVRQSDDFPDSAREMAWVAAPDLQFVNQWVALSGDQVIAHGPQGKIVYESARAKGIDSPFMFFVEEPNHTPFAGGWK
jgi:hypothetical protein